MTMTEAEYIELLAEIDRLRASRAELLAAAERASIVLCKLMEASIAKAEESER